MSKLSEIDEFIRDDLQDNDLFVAVYIGEHEYNTLHLLEKEKNELRELVKKWRDERQSAYVPEKVAGMYVPKKYRGKLQKLLKEIEENAVDEDV